MTPARMQLRTMKDCVRSLSNITYCRVYRIDAVESHSGKVVAILEGRE